MNLMRHRKAHSARRQTLRRSALLMLACMITLAGSNFKFAGTRAGAATKQQQPRTKLSGPMRKAPLTESQQPAKPIKQTAQVDGITPQSTNCANKTPINPNSTVSGTLATGDCTLPGDGTFYDEYTFTASAGQQVSVSMSSSTLDTFLYLLKPSETAANNATQFKNDDDCTTGTPTNCVPTTTNSRIPRTVDANVVTLPETGTYSIIANLFPAVDRPLTGAYSLTLNFGGTGGTICPPAPTALANGQTLNGSLASGDCTLAAQDGTTPFYDAYSFSATAGQQVSISLVGTGFDAYLLLLAPDGADIAEDNDGGGTTNARLPQTAGFARLPQTGTYTIYTTSARTGETGNYSISLNFASGNCPSTPLAIGSTGSFSLATTDCRLLEDGSFLDAYTFNGTAGQQIAITMSAPGSGLNPFLFLLSPTGSSLANTFNTSSTSVNSVRLPDNGGFFTLPTTGTYTIIANSVATGQTGPYTLALTTSTGPACTYTLTPASATVPGAGGNFSINVTTQAGCSLTASQVSSNASWLTVGAVNVSGGGNGTVNYTAASNNTGVPRMGALIIAAQTFTVTQPELTPVATSLQFSTANYTVGESDGQATITVTRTNDTSGAATVDYRTADSDTFTVGCADTVNNRGAAFGRCDFATTLDTLRFAAGEASKTFVVPIINDVHVEGNETFQVVLSNPTGAALGLQTTATVTITDNDVAGQANPIFQTPFFVRQQYLDFLAREPEVREPWSGILNGCPDVNTGPAVPSGCDRINVSGSFFGSPEFRDKGVYVIVFYRVAFNRLPTYAEFAVDLRGVTGTTGPETLAKRATFATAFTQRSEFTNTYGVLADANYVAALLARYSNTASITTIDPNDPNGTTKVTLTRADLSGRLTAGTLTRAQVLRAIVQSDQISANAEATNAFVASQYYGYLRRTPDDGGFNGWVNYLTAHPGDFRTMVNGFLNSVEYRLRFGQNTQ